MKSLSKNQWIAIATAVVVIGFFVFSGDFMRLFGRLEPEALNEGGLTQEIVMQAPGFIVQDVVVGTGQTAEAGDFVSVNYTGYLSTGEVFDSSITRGQPFQFILGIGQVIQGWDQGVAGMKVGGRRRLVIPPELAYGSTERGPIPANSTLIFDVELLGVQKPQ